jgi:cation diffusion facilitator family transporter
MRLELSWRSARSYMWLSLGAALVTMALKFGAFAVSHSIGLFSDAAESVVNLIAAAGGIWALTVAARPADEVHAYGHTKAEYFSSGLEGALILIAAGSIAYVAIERLVHPRAVEQIGLGLLVAILATVVNLLTSLELERAGRRLRSVTLRADARHLLTDVWTTGGVLLGVALFAVTRWAPLDSIVALLVAANILRIGVQLLRESGLGLLDTALPSEDLHAIESVLARYRAGGIEFHALRTRRSGTRRFVSLHVLVPGTWTVQRGHDLCEAIELALHGALPETTVFTHLEPREDPAAFADQSLDRAAD